MLEVRAGSYGVLVLFPIHPTGQNQEPSFDGLNRHGKLRYSWAVDLKAAG